MHIPASLQSAGATVVTRTVGIAARCYDQRNHPEVLKPMLQKESILLAATGLLTMAVQELFDRLIIPEVSRGSFLTRNQTLWRAILAAPGLILIECLSRKFFQSLKQTSKASPTVLGEEYLPYLRFMKRCENRR
jgi:hypothetical protein